MDDSEIWDDGSGDFDKKAREREWNVMRKYYATISKLHYNYIITILSQVIEKE